MENGKGKCKEERGIECFADFGVVSWGYSCTDNGEI